MRSIFTFLIAGLLLTGASPTIMRAQFITPEQTSIDVGSAAGSTSVNVSSDVTWTASADAGWITPSNNGSGQLVIDYQENTSIDERSGTITLTDGSATATVTVNQDGAALSISVNPDNQNVSAAAGNTSFTVTANFDDWTINESEGWLTAAINGSQIEVDYEVNNSTSERIGTITISRSGISDIDVTVTQAGAAPYLTVDPLAVTLGSSSGSTAISVSSNAVWNANDAAAWTTLTVNPNSLTISVLENVSIDSRSSDITITTGSLTEIVTITQEGASPVLTVTPSNRDVTSSAGTTSFEASSNFTTWGVNENENWLTASKSGNQINVNYEANASASGRVGTITVSGESITRTITVTQDGAAAFITPDETTVNVGSGDSQTSVGVSSNVNWTISESITWLSASKNGINLNIDYDANSGTSGRSGTITLNSSEGASATVTVNQAGSDPVLEVNPSNQNVSSGAGSAVFSVSSNMAWDASDDAPWLTLSTTSNQITTNFSENTAIVSRTGTITVTAGSLTQEVTVTQAGAAAILTVNPASKTVSSDEGLTTFDVTANFTTWTVNESVTWIIASKSGAQVSVAYVENPGITSRSGNITVSGEGITRTITLTQEGQTAGLTVSPATQNVGGTSGTTAFTVTANFTTWTAVENANWLTVSKSGSQVNVNYDANPTVNPRTDTVTISGEGITRKVTVVQAGAAPSLDVEPETKQVTNSAGNASFTVAANFTDWTVSKTGDWISSAVKSGNTINVAYQVNETISARTGKVIAAGRGVVDTVTIMQEAGAAAITVAPSSREVAYTAGNTDFTVEANVEWTVNDNADWLHAGRSEQIINVSYDLNNNITSRQAVITVAGSGVTKQVTVTQAGAPAYITPDETTINIGNASGSASVNVVSNVNWTPTENSSWFSVAKNGTQVNITYDANLTISQRTGTISLGSAQGGSASITVVQAAGLPFITLETEAVNINSYNAGSVSTEVTANVAWTAVENSDWFDVTYTSNSISINYIENMTVSSRTANITVSGSGVTKNISVTQAAGPERLTVNPTSQSLSYMEGDASFTVESNVSWSVSEGLNWLGIIKDTQKFTVVALENMSADSRAGNITVKGSSVTRTIPVTQSGAPPSIDAQPENNEVEYTAGNGVFTVTSNFSNWSVSDDADWVTAVKSGSQVNITYQENKTVNVRIGKVIVSGRGVSDTVTVTQHAGLSDLNVTPLSRNVNYPAGETSFSVTSNVEWNVTEEVSWLTAVKNGTQISAVFEENPSTNSRTGNITLSGGTITHTLSVTQEGRPESIILTPSLAEVEYTAGTASFDVAVNTDSWSVSENVSWLTATMNGMKTNITYEENTSISPRSGKITITAGDSSKVFTLTQKGTPTAISADPENASVSFLEGGVSFNIASNVEWIVSENTEWLSAVRSGNSVQVNYTKNNLREQRQGIVTVSGGGSSINISITQGGNLEVDKPALLSPANNVYKSGLNLLFEWNEPELAESYTLEISDSVQFTNIIYSYDDIAENSYTIAGLKEGLKYYWRVKASNSYGYFTYSDVWSFTSKLLQPGNLRISQNAFNEVILSWQDNSKNETGYDILRKTGSGQFAKLTSVPSGQVNYIDAEIILSGEYTYRVYAYNDASVSDTSEVSIIVTIIGIDDDLPLDIPTEYSLSNAYPNPFNPSANIRYGLPEESAVVIEVFNILGERVETLLNEHVSAGYHETKWNASNMPSGIYIIRTYAKSLYSDRKFVSVKKAMLLK